MRVFKTTYNDRNKQKKTSEKWYLEFRNHLEEVHRLPAFTDKRQSEALGRQIDKLIHCRMSGETPDREIVKWIECLPKRMSKNLVKWRLIDAKQAGTGRTLNEHLKEFKTYLTDKGTTPEYASKIEYRITQILNGIGAVVWSDVSYSNVQRYLADKRQAGKMKIATANHYLAAIREFLGWMVIDKRSPANPLELIERLSDVSEDKRRRRPFTVEELRKLITTTTSAPMVRNICGQERALIYKFATETGLRANEIRTLLVSDFDLSALTVQVRAKNAKSRRAASIPLRNDTAEMLKEHFKGKLPAVAAFKVPPKGHEVRMLRTDLKRAGIPYMDEDGRYSDFHSLRYTTASLLAASGVNPKVIQTIMRHSDINLTMQIYTHVYSEAPTKAIASLPDLSLPPTVEKILKTGTDDRVVDAVNSSGIVVKKTENCSASCLAFQCEKGRISANKNELQASDFSKNSDASKKPITAIKHSYRHNDIGVPSSVHRVEAGGFEPPSRDTSRKASTCVVDFLFLAFSDAKRQASESASSVQFHYNALSVHISYSR